jgi:hypothetical protein
MSAAKPFLLRIFFGGGDPDDLCVVERSNWSAKALIFPRGLMPKAKQRDELGQTGVVLLFGSRDDSEQILPTLFAESVLLRSGRFRTRKLCRIVQIAHTFRGVSVVVTLLQRLSRLHFAVHRLGLGSEAKHEWAHRGKDVQRRTLRAVREQESRCATA